MKKEARYHPIRAQGMIPTALLLPTPFPEWAGETVGDLVGYAQDCESALASANADKEAVRRVIAGEEGTALGKESR